MRSSGTVRQVTAAVTALALIGAACGDDNGDAASEADAAAFCEQFAALESSDGDDDAETLEALAATAPGELRADLERMAAWFAELEELEDEAEATGAAIELTADPEYRATVARIEDFLVDECGIDPVEVADVAPGTIDTAPTIDGELDGEEGVPHAAFEAALADRFGDRVGGVGKISQDGSFDFDANIADLTPEEALTACEELSRFLADHPDASGEASLLLTDHSFERSPIELARNERITPGDPGTCEAV